MEDFVEVADEAQLQEGTAIGVMAFGYRVALFRLGDHCYALGARCPHAGGPLDDGYIAEDTIVCPWHASRFRITTGELVGGPATEGVPLFPVEVRAGKILVGPPPPGTAPPPPSLF